MRQIVVCHAVPVKILRLAPAFPDENCYSRNLFGWQKHTYRK